MSNFDASIYESKTVRGETYIRRRGEQSNYFVQATGPGFRSRDRWAKKRSDVAPIFRGIARSYGPEGSGIAKSIVVKDYSWMTADGSCRTLTVSDYGVVNGEWRHYFGPVVTGMGEAF